MMASATSGRVRIEEGVVFGKGGGRELRCDVYRPPVETRNAAAILLLHGGGWRQGDRTQLRGYGILLGRAGYLCVASEYRLSGEARWPAQIHDVKAALRWMRAESRALEIDPEKIAVSGNSAGAHLALVLAGTPGHAPFEGSGGNAGAAAHVSAAIAFYAPVDLAPGALRTEDSVVSELFGPGVSEADVQAASPLSHARAGFPPTLLIHGTHDAIVPVEASVRMYQELSKAGASSELHVYSGAPHGFDAERRLGRQCAEIMQLFLDRHVAGGAEVSDAAAARSGSAPGPRPEARA
jgi:acetyl esterase/lipase